VLPLPHSTLEIFQSDQPKNWDLTKHLFIEPHITVFLWFSMQNGKGNLRKLVYSCTFCRIAVRNKTRQKNSVQIFPVPIYFFPAPCGKNFGPWATWTVRKRRYRYTIRHVEDNDRQEIENALRSTHQVNENTFHELKFLSWFAKLNLKNKAEK
jgi:hypothetical protein